MELNGHIFLIGFMGSGKSTNAACLARLADAKRIEMDDAITESQGMEIREIFRKYGEEHFRDLETGFLKSLLDREPAVVS